MSRVNFSYTVTTTNASGYMVPVPNVGVTVYTINYDQSQGVQGVAYAGRTGETLATLSTSIQGTVNFWVEAGDYDIVFADQESPPRIATFTIGFASLDPDSTQVEPFTGDLKHSVQAIDHGQNEDGSYQWLLITQDSDGGGRPIPAATYGSLWNEMGQPTLDGSGNFRLPNLSGTALVATGVYEGASNPNIGEMTVRSLLAQFGSETHLLTYNEMPTHYHAITDPGHGHSGNTGSGNAQIQYSYTGIYDRGHSHNIPGDVMSSGASGYSAAGGSAWTIGYSAGNDNTSSGAAQLQDNQHNHSDSGHTHPIATDTTHITIQYAGGAGAGTGAGSTSAHNIIQPSSALNLFVKT